MTTRLCLAFAVALALLAVAKAQVNPISLQTAIYIVGPDGSFMPATTARPGDVIEYRIFATNTGETTLPAGRIQVLGPVQDGMDFVPESTHSSSDLALTEFSVDGSSFSLPPLRVGFGSTARLVDASEYRVVRWTLVEPMEPGQREEFRYQVRLHGEAPATPQPAVGTSAAGFQILSVIYRWEGDYLYVVGELQNSSGVAQGVELQANARDASGRLVDSVNFWPASISNIAIGARYGFRYPVTRQTSAVTVDVQVVGTRDW